MPSCVRPHHRPLGLHFIVEVLGLVVVSALSVVVLSDLLTGPRRGLLLTDGDSLVLAMMQRSLVDGAPDQWALSPVLFLVPELPLFLICDFITGDTATAFLLDAVVNVLIVYALLRFVVVAIARSSPLPVTSARQVSAAVGAVTFWAICCLLERRPPTNPRSLESTRTTSTFELAGLLETTTYYSGTIMAALALFGLVLRLVARPRSKRGLVGVVGALGTVTAAATFSNPLVVIWATLPLGATLLIMAALRPALRRLALAGGAALALGTLAGMAARWPVRTHFFVDTSSHVAPQLVRATVVSLACAAQNSLASPGGAAEVLIVGVVALAGTVAAIVSIRRRTDPVATVALMGGAVTALLLPAALVLTGSGPVRYLQIVLYTLLPTVSLGLLHPAVSRTASAAARLVVGRRDGRRSMTTLGLLASCVPVVAGVAGLPRILSVDEGSVRHESGADCLDAWLTRESVSEAGAGRFFTSRALDVWATAPHTIVPIDRSLNLRPWIINLAGYHDVTVGYLLAGHDDTWGSELSNLGAPAAVVSCPAFDILDFRGTAAESRLTEELNQQVDAVSREHGFAAHVDRDRSRE